MNGTSHYDHADAILGDLAEMGETELDDHTEFLLRKAAVHAQLATAGALAALIAEARRGTFAIPPSTRPASSPDLERRS